MQENFSAIKNDILGKKYSLSIASVDEETSRKLNKKYRNKNKSTNILSFALSKNMGEIVLCPTVIKKGAKSFGKTFRQLTGFLVIHGMLHLKGYNHGNKMEKLERLYYKKFKIN